MEDDVKEENMNIVGSTTIYDDGFVNSDDIIILDGEDEGEKRSCTLTSDEFIKFDSGSDFNHDEDAFEEDNLEENDEDDDVQIKNETMEFLMEQEKMLLNTPSLNTLQSDLRKLSGGRIVHAYSFEMNELFSSEVLELLLSSASNEITINLVKSKHLEDQPWTGYVTLNLDSQKEAKKVSNNLKKFKEDLHIACDNSMSDKKVKTCREWIKDEKQEELDVSERVLLVSNPSLDIITEEDLLDLFPEAVETCVKRQNTPYNNTSLGYVVFESNEVAHAVAVEADQQRRDLNSLGQHFYIYKYVKPQNIHRDLLMVQERYLILRYIDRLKRAIKRSSINPKYKIPEYCSQRLERSLNVIERDNKLRLCAGLSPPTTIDLLGVKKLKGSSWYNVLINHKIIDKNNSDGANLIMDQKSRSLISNDNKSRDFRNHIGKRHSINKYIGKNKSNNNDESLLGEPPAKIPSIIPQLFIQNNLNMMGMMQNQLSRNYGGVDNNRFLWSRGKGNWTNVSSSSYSQRR